jgi:hypothetical protein
MESPLFAARSVPNNPRLRQSNNIAGPRFAGIERTRRFRRDLTAAAAAEISVRQLFCAFLTEELDAHGDDDPIAVRYKHAHDD